MISVASKAIFLGVVTPECVLDEVVPGPWCGSCALVLGYKPWPPHMTQQLTLPLFSLSKSPHRRNPGLDGVTKCGIVPQVSKSWHFQPFTLSLIPTPKFQGSFVR